MTTDKKYSRIGIVAAMSAELDALKPRLSEVTAREISGIVFYEGKYKNTNVVIAKSGVGKVFAAICVQTMILQYEPDMILHIGVAGGLSAGLSIGDIAIASSVVQHDMDTTAVGDPLGMISGIDLINIPCAENIVCTLRECAEKLGFHYEVGVIASGDCFMNDRARKEHVIQSFNAIACEMEGGSTGQVCYVNSVDFCVIRAISDNGDERSGVDYSASLAAASNASLRLTEAFLTEMDSAAEQPVQP